MFSRRKFITASASLASVPLLAQTPNGTLGSPVDPKADPGPADRAYWVTVADRLARPVLENLSKGTLALRIPQRGKTPAARKTFAPLEALGRLLTGFAPWLECEGLTGDEGRLRSHYSELARAGLAMATDPKSPDYMRFADGGQPLVDAAFLGHALLRAPRELWQKLDAKTQATVIAALKSTRAIKPGESNWLFFSAMVEAALFRCGAGFEAAPVQKAIESFEKWYVGDGAYGDGSRFHWDYYNSFVIHPMRVDVGETLGSQEPAWAKLQPEVLKRARRYAAIQERLIGLDGTYPIIGRSVVYRCGAFHALAQSALRKDLPEGVIAPQVRGALTAVIRRTLEAPGTFDADGWLNIGLAGQQVALSESYISTGSSYLCASALLPLGLSPKESFWHGQAKWTAQKVWSGEDIPADHAI
jgi:hypothetical protein